MCDCIIAALCFYVSLGTGSAISTDVGPVKRQTQWHMQGIESLFHFSVACDNLVNEFKSGITSLR